MQRWLKLIEYTLTYFSWLKLDKVSYSQVEKPSKTCRNRTVGTDSQAEDSIRQYMKLFYELVKHPDGNKNKKYEGSPEPSYTSLLEEIWKLG